MDISNRQSVISNQKGERPVHWEDLERFLLGGAGFPSFLAASHLPDEDIAKVETQTREDQEGRRGIARLKG